MILELLSQLEVHVVFPGSVSRSPQCYAWASLGPCGFLASLLIPEWRTAQCQPQTPASDLTLGSIARLRPPAPGVVGNGILSVSVRSDRCQPSCSPGCGRQGVEPLFSPTLGGVCLSSRLRLISFNPIYHPSSPPISEGRLAASTHHRGACFPFSSLVSAEAALRLSS